MRLSGIEGADGIGIEYIYYLKNNANPPSPIPIGIGNGWTADPVGVSQSFKYEFVSYRTIIGPTKSDFSTPVLWAKYGSDGIGIEYIYKTTTIQVAPERPIGVGPITPTGWTDEPSGVSTSVKNEWISTSQYSNEAWGSGAYQLCS